MRTLNRLISFEKLLDRYKDYGVDFTAWKQYRNSVKDWLNGRGTKVPNTVTAWGLKGTKKGSREAAKRLASSLEAIISDVERETLPPAEHNQIVMRVG